MQGRLLRSTLKKKVTIVQWEGLALWQSYFTLWQSSSFIDMPCRMCHKSSEVKAAKSEKTWEKQLWSRSQAEDSLTTFARQHQSHKKLLQLEHLKQGGCGFETVWYGMITSTILNLFNRRLEAMMWVILSDSVITCDLVGVSLAKAEQTCSRSFGPGRPSILDSRQSVDSQSTIEVVSFEHWEMECGRVWHSCSCVVV